MSSTPFPAAVALLATLVVTGAALAAFLAEIAAPGGYLALFTVFFAARVAGQLVVLARRPAWLPPMEQWNLLPYPILLPLQLALLVLMVLLAGGRLQPGAPTARFLVGAAFLYSLAMGVRYAVRMVRRPGERWFGGTIPIVFHCVLAAFLFVLGAAHA